MVVYSLYFSEHSFDYFSFKAYNSFSIMALAKIIFFGRSEDFGEKGGIKI